jgi:hypothetical protein
LGWFYTHTHARTHAHTHTHTHTNTHTHTHTHTHTKALVTYALTGKVKGLGFRVQDLEFRV